MRCRAAALLALGLLMPGAAAASRPDASSLSRCAAAAPDGPSALRSGALSRGVNMTDALRLSTPMAQVERDMRTVRRLGMRHVRLPVRPDAALAWSGSGPPGATLRRLDAVACAAVRAGLAIIIDLHPEGRLALRDGSGDAAVERLATAWDHLAGRYAAIPPSMMAFELLNEPGLTSADRWARDQNALLARIRAAAPRHAVLLTAAPTSTAAALAFLAPTPDAEVGYVFHFYSPMIFTHQGADWTTPDRSSAKGLAYPADPANVAQVRRDAPPGLQPDLDAYARHDGSAAAIGAEIGQAAAWATRNHARLFVTEFGVFHEADPASRRAWLRDVRAALEASGIGWTAWEYRGGFGVDAGLGRPCADPDSIRRALGLCVPPKHAP